MKEEYQERIEDYLFNRITNDEKLAFEQELDKNKELRDQYEFTSSVRTALMLENIEKDVKEWTTEYTTRKEALMAASEYLPTGSGYEDMTVNTAPNQVEEHKVITHTSPRSFLYWISGMVAAFAIFFIIFNWDTTINNLDKGKKIAERAIKKEGSKLSSSGGREELLGSGAPISSSKEYDITNEDKKIALAQIQQEEQQIELLIMRYEQPEMSRDPSDNNDVLQINALSLQLDELRWKRANLLLELHYTKEAILLMDSISKSNSIYRLKAEDKMRSLK